MKQVKILSTHQEVKKQKGKAIIETLGAFMSFVSGTKYNGMNHEH